MLANSDRIPMPNTVKLIFETDSLENVSPAIISKTGVIYMSGSGSQWRALLQAWVKDWPKEQRDVINQMADGSGLFDALLSLLDTQFKTALSPPPLGIIRQF